MGSGKLTRSADLALLRPMRLGAYETAVELYEASAERSIAPTQTGETFASAQRRMGELLESQASALVVMRAAAWGGGGAHRLIWVAEAGLRTISARALRSFNASCVMISSAGDAQLCPCAHHEAVRAYHEVHVCSMPLRLHHQDVDVRVQALGTIASLIDEESEEVGARVNRLKG